MENWKLAGEELARRIVQNALGITVDLYDDGSSPGMYDLRIGSVESPQVTIECVGAVDSAFIETWNVGPAKGPLKLDVIGDWIVEIRASARVKDVKQHMTQLISQLEAKAIYGLNIDPSFK